MVLSFKGGKTDLILQVNHNNKTYKTFLGVASHSIELATQKEVRNLELRLIEGGYKHE